MYTILVLTKKIKLERMRTNVAMATIINPNLAEEIEMDIIELLGFNCGLQLCDTSSSFGKA